MKHYYLFLFLLFLIPSISKAQVGIGTDPEKGSILHIKGTNTDVIVDSLTGRVGIGVSRSSLQEKLEVKGNTKVEGTAYVDGSLILKEKSLIRDTLSTVTTAGYAHHAVLEIVDTVGGAPVMIIEDTDFAADKYIMTDEEGNAVWKDLRVPMQIGGFDDATKTLKQLYTSSLADQRIIGSYAYSTAANEYEYLSNYTDITDNPLILGKGKWMILAQYATRAVVSNQSPEMIYTALVSKQTSNTTGSFGKEMVFGVQPEQNGFSICTPQLFTVITVEEETEFRIRSVGVKYRSYVDDGTKSFFCAVKLSEE